ncbi:GNAT family N-acetyltransferase [Caldimonas sp. KR1-144]|uniref:GNAT family N-acetyltransferase n=1 Tax=Caldimonas sp. KR1-144 TaxID=3400911 RepID=UPI003C01E33E
MTAPSPTPIGAASGPNVLAALFRWVPIRSLAARHRPRIEAHLKSLGPNDRYLRFGYPASDHQIANYVSGLDFDRDEVFGIFNRRLELIAMAHLAYERPQQVEGRPAMAEFGVSVASTARGRGYGARLFDHAIMHARNRGIDRLFIHALSENLVMLRIARSAGATVERDGGESQAWLRLPPDTLASQIGEVVEAHAAEMNYQIKRNVRAIEDLLDTVGEVRDQISAKRGRAASE